MAIQEGVGVKSEKAVREFVSALHRTYTLLPRIEANKLVYGSLHSLYVYRSIWGFGYEIACLFPILEAGITSSKISNT